MFEKMGRSQGCGPHPLAVRRANIQIDRSIIDAEGCSFLPVVRSRHDPQIKAGPEAAVANLIPHAAIEAQPHTATSVRMPPCSI